MNTNGCNGSMTTLNYYDRVHNLSALDLVDNFPNLKAGGDWWDQASNGHAYPSKNQLIQSTMRKETEDIRLEMSANAELLSKCYWQL